MTHRPRLTTWVDRRLDEETKPAGRKADDGGLTPHQKLVRAAETGRFEAIVAAAQPSEPPKMVTPEEREAELRATGKWPDQPKARRKTAPKRKPKEPEPEVSPQQQYIDEHCHWSTRRRSDYGPRHRENQYISEYDPLTGEIEGDGYIRHEGEDES